jgi:tetratricopeptide (TPR) repeat protein
MIDYESLKDEVVSFNRTGLDFLLDQAEEALNVNDLKRTERIVSVLDRDFADRAEALMVKSRYALLSGREPEAVELAESAFDLDVTYSGPTGFLQNQYQRTGQWEKLVELHDRLLAARSRFSSGRLPRLLEDRARTMMMLCRYDEAESSYREVWAHEQKSQMSPATALISLFNIAESHRRASRVIHTDEWEKVAELFSQSGTASDQPLNIQANQWQAMHIAFACIGNLSAASDALKKARRVAEAAGEIEEMFSVEYYRHVALAEFISSNEKMIQALDRRQLWDGMSLVSRAEDVRS